MSEPAQPFGSWPSPISAASVAAGGLRLSELQYGDDGSAYWVEGRAAENGRCVVVRASNGACEDVIAVPFSARTTVHEYGGGAMLAADGAVFFANASDRRLYRVEPGSAPQALTPELGDLRYADLALDAARRRLVFVAEDHRGGAVVNDLRAVPLQGGEPVSLVSGNDFYSTPRLSPDGTQLCWLTWNQPNMPWDGTELWCASLDDAGQPRDARQVAGSVRESVFQPSWSSESVLHFVSDPTGWWNLYRADASGVVPLAPMEAECGRAQWLFGMSTYAFCAHGRIALCVCRDGAWQLVILDTASGTNTPLELPYNALGAFMDAHGDTVLANAGGPRHTSGVVEIDINTASHQVLRSSSAVVIPDAVRSEARPITFPGHGGATAHAWYYAPRNDAVHVPADELPPLLVQAHGGPTSATNPALDPGVQYWTSRGIAYVDVDYGGSTGYGRAYRERLNGEEGVVDVGDCIAAAQFLAAQGAADGERLLITGGSAGGYIVLCAMTFHDVFASGSSLYGIADLESLIEDTHKFEARYFDSMVGPYPDMRDRYYERSPIHFIENVRRPIILFQGLDDPIVPANQAEMMYEALRSVGVPCAYVAYPGEQHGFRIAANIQRTLQGELYFFSRVLGFRPADRLEPVPIANLQHDPGD